MSTTIYTFRLENGCVFSFFFLQKLFVFLVVFSFAMKTFYELSSDDAHYTTRCALQDTSVFLFQTFSKRSDKHCALKIKTHTHTHRCPKQKRPTTTPNERISSRRGIHRKLLLCTGAYIVGGEKDRRPTITFVIRVIYLNAIRNSERDKKSKRNATHSNFI